MQTAATAPGQPGGSALPMAGAVAFAARTLAATGGVDRAAATAPPPLAPRLAAALFGAPSGFLPPGAAPEAPEGGAAPSAPVASASTTEEYGRQLMHLFHGEQGVHAYIRDAELGGAQLRAVAQALAAELSASGKRLAGLTVNGRRVDAGDEAGGEERPATASWAAPLPIIEKGIN
jgi:hypothetical protein